MNGLQTLPQWRQFFGNPEGASIRSKAPSRSGLGSLHRVCHLARHVQGPSKLRRRKSFARLLHNFHQPAEPYPHHGIGLPYPPRPNHSFVQHIFCTLNLREGPNSLGNLLTNILRSTLAPFLLHGALLEPSRLRLRGAGESRLCCKEQFL